MSPKSDTWMAFYVGDYVANTLHLARENHGSYLMLILGAFKNGGWIPNDDIFLATIAKCTPKEWKRERHVYAGFFVVTDERWTHRRVTHELGKAEELTEKRSKAGSNGAAKRWQTHGNGIAEPQQNDGPSEPHPKAKALGARLPENWQPSDEDRAFAEQYGKNADAVAASFRDYWRGVPGAKGRKADWPGTWRNWIRRDAESRRSTDPPKAAGWN